MSDLDFSKVTKKSNYELYGDAADEIERLYAEVGDGHKEIERLEGLMRQIQATTSDRIGSLEARINVYRQYWQDGIALCDALDDKLAALDKEQT